MCISLTAIGKMFSICCLHLTSSRRVQRWKTNSGFDHCSNQIDSYMLKVNIGRWHRSSVFFVNFEHTSDLGLVFRLLTLSSE